MNSADVDRMIKELHTGQTKLQEGQRELQEGQRELQAAKIETEKQLRELGKQIGGIGEKFGSFTEGLAYPSMTKLLYKKFKIDNTVANYLRRLPNGKCIEYDAFGYTNGTVNNAVVVEVKSHLQYKHVAEFVKKLNDFPQVMPTEYHNKHLYGIICTVKNVSSELRQHAEESGLYIATVQDEIFKLHENKSARDFKK